MTEPGTVFVLEPTNPSKLMEAQHFIETWFGSGLMQPPWAIDRYGGTFATNPFLPGDGFGEIVVNLPALWKLAIPESEVKPL